MKPAPKGWPRLTTAVFYEDANRAIDWLCKAFGFEVQLKVEEGGRVVHSQLVFGEALVMVAEPTGKARDGYVTPAATPSSIGGKITQSIMIFVDDAEAHCARARAAGAKITYAPTVSDYGPDYWADKSYQAVDLDGHHWWFCERVRG